VSDIGDCRIVPGGFFRNTTGGGGASTQLNLDDLGDVQITSVANNEILRYDDTQGFWVNSAVTTLPLVTSFNGLTGAVQGVSAAVAGTGISVSGATGAVTITNIGVQSFNGLTGAVTGVASIRGLTGAVGITNGTGIGLGVSGQTMTFSNTGVLSIDGSTGAITNVARTNVDNNFSSAQTIDAPGAFLEIIGSNTAFTLTPGVGIAVSDSVNFPQTLQFNQTGTTTTVTLPNYTTTLAGLSGNQTFTALNTFSAGISAAGATLSSNTTIPSGSTLTVNGNFVANGNVNLGDAVTDAITVTGVLAANGGLSAAGGTFSSLTRFTAGISSAGGTFSSLTRFTAGITASTLYVSGGATFAGALSAVDVYATAVYASGGIFPSGSNTLNSNTNGNSITNIGDVNNDNNNTNIQVDDSTGTITLSAPVGGINNSGGFLNQVSAPSFADTYSFCQTYRTTTSGVTANQTIATIPEVYDNSTSTMNYPAFEITISARDTVLNKTEMLKMLVVQDGTNTVNTQYGLIRTGATGPVSSYSTTLSGALLKNLLIRATPLSANSTAFTTTVRAQSNG
jgi:hypothetical protein